MSTLSAVLAQWQFVGADLGHSTVLPDGRRDLNLNQAAEGRALDHLGPGIQRLPRTRSPG